MEFHCSSANAKKIFVHPWPANEKLILMIGDNTSDDRFITLCEAKTWPTCGVRIIQHFDYQVNGWVCPGGWF